MHLSSSHTRYMIRPFNSSSFGHTNNIWWGGETMKLLKVQSPPMLWYLVQLKKYLPRHPNLEKLQPIFPHYYRRHSLVAYKVALWQFFLRVIRLSPVSTIPTVRHTHISFIHQWHYKNLRKWQRR
jgi:hypothetical protein